MAKNIVFDFDHTLTTFDTIYPFFKFCNKDNFILYNIKKGQWLFFLLLHRLKIFSNYDLKDRGVKLFLKGYSPEYIQEMSQKFYQKITYHNDVIEEFVLYLESGNNVYISSASFCDYLTIFAEKYQNVGLLCSTLNYINNKVKGIDINNYGENKLVYFQDKNIEIDVLYTDSYSDRFLAKISKKIKIISKNGNIIEFNNYEEFSNYFNKG